jgi:hypothetical protein
MKIALPTRTIASPTVSGFVYNIARGFDFESQWRRAVLQAGGSKFASEALKPVFICPFCNAPFVRMRISAEQSSNPQENSAALVTLTCEQKHWVEIRLEQCSSCVRLSSQAQAPSPRKNPGQGPRRIAPRRSAMPYGR